MTQKFDSKGKAIIRGLFYAGRSDLYNSENGKEKKTFEEILKNPEIKIVAGDMVQFGLVHEDNGIIRIATTKLEDGYDLWLVNPKSGAGIRA